MIRSHRLQITLFVLLGLILSTPSFYAIPNFARKYKLDCSTCHAPIPRLNEFGFKFRAAGFRLPEEIGKDVSTTNLSDYYAARIQARYDLGRSEAANGVVTNTNRFSFFELTVYPMSGAYGKYLSSLVELTFAPDSPAEIENAYARVTLGQENSYFTVRAGVFHPFEGYGASDRPLGLSRPLFQTTKATGTQFKPWGYDEAGVEFGYSTDNTFIRGTLFNGILGSGDPAQGGNLARVKTDPSWNSMDYQITITHMLTGDGGGITGYLYSGNVDLNTGLAAPDPSLFQNSFMRYAIYASYPIQNALLLAGYQKGQDDTFNATLKSKGDSFNSNGFFGEVDYAFQDQLWFGVRYAQFTPAENKSNNKINALTASVNYSFDNGLQLIGEFNHKTTEQGVNLSQKDDNFQLRLIYIY